MLRLLIIAADPLARAGLAAMFANEPDYLVTGQIAPDDGDLAATAMLFRPDVLLFDTGWEGEAALAHFGELQSLDLPTVALITNMQALLTMSLISMTPLTVKPAT